MSHMDSHMPRENRYPGKHESQDWESFPADTWQLKGDITVNKSQNQQWIDPTDKYCLFWWDVPPMSLP